MQVDTNVVIQANGSHLCSQEPPPGRNWVADVVIFVDKLPVVVFALGPPPDPSASDITTMRESPSTPDSESDVESRKYVEGGSDVRSLEEPERDSDGGSDDAFDTESNDNLDLESINDKITVKTPNEIRQVKKPPYEAHTYWFRNSNVQLVVALDVFEGPTQYLLPGPNPGITLLSETELKEKRAEGVSPPIWRDVEAIDRILVGQLCASASVLWLERGNNGQLDRVAQSDPVRDIFCEGYFLLTAFKAFSKR